MGFCEVSQENPNLGTSIRTVSSSLSADAKLSRHDKYSPRLPLMGLKRHFCQGHSVRMLLPPTNVSRYECIPYRQNQRRRSRTTWSDDVGRNADRLRETRHEFEARLTVQLSWLSQLMQQRFGPSARCERIAFQMARHSSEGSTVERIISESVDILIIVHGVAPWAAAAARRDPGPLMASQRGTWVRLSTHHTGASGRPNDLPIFDRSSQFSFSEGRFASLASSSASNCSTVRRFDGSVSISRSSR
jgi:hypothetical protein